MLSKTLLIGTLVLGSAVAGYASPTPDAMRAASAVAKNIKYSTSISLTRDPDSNIVSFHVNGVDPEDAEKLLSKDPSPLSTEYTIITGRTKEGTTSSFMLPSNIATASVVESISQDLVNSGSISIQITKQQTGKV